MTQICTCCGSTDTAPTRGLFGEALCSYCLRWGRALLAGWLGW